MNTKAFEQDKLNLKHLHSPQIGDYWQEMLCPTLVVVDVKKIGVLICKTKKNLVDGWTWNLDKLEWLSLNEFAKYLCYDEKLKDKTWSNVVPEAHKWVTDCVK